VIFFSALGYVVGLPSFIVGTAVFMLGFALRDADILNVACLLYSLALVSIGGRPMLLRLNPQNEIQALKIAALSRCRRDLLRRTTRDSHGNRYPDGWVNEIGCLVPSSDYSSPRSSFKRPPPIA
jgi:hypothetical protein